MDLEQIVLPHECYAKFGSKSRVAALERAGRFPKRRYLDADDPRPRRPFWLRSELEAHMAELVRQSEAAVARVKAHIAVIQAARLEKAGRASVSGVHLAGT